MKITRKEFSARTGGRIGWRGKSVKAIGVRRVAGKPWLRPSAVGAPAAPRWGMAIDFSKCRKGCDECTSALAAWPITFRRFPIPTRKSSGYGKNNMRRSSPPSLTDYARQDLAASQLLVLCNHCADPPCTRVCPTQATWKRDDGIVMMDYHRCIGCRYCMAACPYGSRSFNWVDPRPYIETVNPQYPTRTKGVVEKCNFCEERLADGLLPACVEACQEKALISAI